MAEWKMMLRIFFDWVKKMSHINGNRLKITEIQQKEEAIYRKYLADGLIVMHVQPDLSMIEFRKIN